MNIINLIVQQIENLREDELVELNNEYCYRLGEKGVIYPNDQEFFEIFFSKTGPYDLLMELSRGEYDVNQSWVMIDGSNQVVSFDDFDVDYLLVSAEVIAEYALENDDDFGGLLDLDVDLGGVDEEI